MYIHITKQGNSVSQVASKALPIQLYYRSTFYRYISTGTCTSNTYSRGHHRQCLSIHIKLDTHDITEMSHMERYTEYGKLHYTMLIYDIDQ